MIGHSFQEAAERAGVDRGFLDRLIGLRLLTEHEGGGYSPADVRLVMMVKSLEDGGVSLDGVAAAVESGALSFDFLATPTFERLAALASETFRQVSERTGVALELLMLIREAIGMAQPSADDLLREDELAIVPFLQLQVEEGFRPLSIERLLRVQGESTRKMAEQEGAWWYAEVIAPAIAAGKGADEFSIPDFAARVAATEEAAILAMYHAQQGRIWTANLIDGFEQMLDKAGLHSRLERPPAICFLDITGYTRLTQERGDSAAADLASTLGRLVERSSVRYGGRPIKWLGDGVMLYFPNPGPGVRAALEMVDGIAAAGLPPAHVGLHAGPVLYQAGDYFGQTVNLSARIADYARPAEVLVSRAVADACTENGIDFVDIGPVELKGVSGTVSLLRAHRRSTTS
jgi:class 3 adenylate cyclase